MVLITGGWICCTIQAIKTDEWCSDLMKYCIQPCKCPTCKKTPLKLEHFIMKRENT